MTVLFGRRRLRVPAVFGAAVVLAGLLISPVTAAHAATSRPVPAAAAAQAPPPYVDPFPSRYTISTPNGYATVALSGWIAGLVILSPDPVPYPVSNRWDQIAESYIGPGGLRYHRYRNIDNGNCLAHGSGLLLTKTCTWADNSQWWAVDTVTLPRDCSQGWCWYPTADIFVPWDQSGNAATAQDNLLLLKPREGVTGAPNQRLQIHHVPAPPW